MKYRRRRNISHYLPFQNSGIEKKKPTFIERLFSNEAMLLVLLPVLYFLSNYAYILGYFAEFHIPVKLANFDVNGSGIKTDDFILEAGYISLYFIATYIPLILILPKKLRPQISKFALPVFLSILFLIFNFKEVLFIYKEGIYFVNDGLFRINVTLVGCYLIMLILFNPNFFGKVNLVTIIFGSQVLDDYKKLYEKFFDNNVFRAIGIFFIIYLYFFEMGHIDAHNQTQFYIADTTPECVVLYMGKESAICNTFDREFRKYFNDFRVIYYSTEPEINFRLIDFGPIQLDPSSIYLSGDEMNLPSLLQKATQLQTENNTPTVTGTPLPTVTPKTTTTRTATP